MNEKGEIYLTQLETEVMSVFVANQIFGDETIAQVLRVLAEKLSRP